VSALWRRLGERDVNAASFWAVMCLVAAGLALVVWLIRSGAG